MQREQTHYLRGWGTEAARWLSLIVLALAVTWLPHAGWFAARAETETPAHHTIKQQTAEQQTTKAQEPKQESPEQDDKAADKADDQSDSEADDSGDQSKAEKEGKEDSDKNETREKQADEQSQEEPSKEGDSKVSQETKEMKKKSEDSSAEAKPTGNDEATVETERSVEVDPPKQETKKPEEKPGPSKQPKKKCIIGATATLLEKQSELKFRARVDSGAKSCSLHVEKIKIEDESKQEDIVERMTENIGKVIHFEVKNGDDKMRILTSKIASYVIIKNSNKKEGRRRYKVPLTFRWKHMEKEVLVTLNDRNHMEYPLLLGRNFLRGDFLVDVELNSDD